MAGLTSPPWLHLIALAMLLPGCQALEHPKRLMLAEALTEMRVVNPQEIVRTEHEDVTAVLLYGRQGVQDVVALITLDRATQTVRTHGSSPVAAPEPATLSWSGHDRRLYVYGRITDPSIRTLEIRFMEGSRSFEVSSPGYAIVVDDADDAGPQGWCFLDADGGLVYSPPGRC
jgi:hypothetical protein